MSDNSTQPVQLAGNVKTFVDGVLTGIGAPVNPQTEQAMLNWLANEQGGPNLPDFNQDQGNPLGVQTTSAGLAGSTGNIQGGINATVATLKQSQYVNVVNAFKSGGPTSAIDNAIVASPWNGAHYGGIKRYQATAAGGGTSSSPNATVASTSTGTGCEAKGDVFGEGGFLGIGAIHFTYCELKALLGALCMASGVVLMVVGTATLVVGGLNGQGPAAPIVGAGQAVLAGAGPVGRVATAPARRKAA